MKYIGVILKGSPAMRLTEMDSLSSELEVRQW